MVDTWQWTPFVTLILLAGLQALPTDPYESGRIDGASEWQLFWRITVPLMRWSIAIAVLFRLIDSLKVFETIFILSPGAFDRRPGSRDAEYLRLPRSVGILPHGVRVGPGGAVLSVDFQPEHGRAAVEKERSMSAIWQARLASTGRFSALQVTAHAPLAKEMLFRTCWSC